MLYYNMVCKQKNQENNRFVSAMAHRYVMPVSDHKTWTVTGVMRKDV